MAPSSQASEPPGKPGRFILERSDDEALRRLASLPRDTVERRAGASAETQVRIRDHELHAAQPALAEAAEKFPPRVLHLAVGDRDADHLAFAELVHGVREQHRLGNYVLALADLVV
jgi:hypothetical protein